jgi:ligand-binding SRPBCC domain-containing protein
MPTLEFETTIAAPLETVWAFYEDVVKSLPAISPPADEVTLEPPDLPVRVGSRLVIRAKGPTGRRIRWVAKIVEHRPPHAVVFGAEARFVDEQESRPFKRWRHEHDFEAIDARTTRCADRVSYRAPGGPLAPLVDVLLVRPKLRAMFRYRYEQLHRLLDEPA